MPQFMSEKVQIYKISLFSIMTLFFMLIYFKFFSLSAFNIEQEIQIQVWMPKWLSVEGYLTLMLLFKEMD